MAITNPTVVSTPIVSATGSLTSAGQIEATDTRSVQTIIDSVSTMLTQVGRVGIGWNYETSTDAGAGDMAFRFNNADPAMATSIFFNKNSLSGRFDEFIEQFASGGFIYLQDNTNTGNNYLFSTTALPTDSGTYYTVTVTLEQSSGAFTGIAGDRFNVEFLPISATGMTQLQLPNMFLNEITETDSPVFRRKVDTEAEVRFWLRTALVQQSTIGDPGVGLRIDEANGDLGSDSDTYESGTNANNVYIYMTLDNSFVQGRNLNTLEIIIRENVGESDEAVKHAVNFGMNFQEETGLTLSGVTVYRSNTGFDGNGPLIHYHNNDTIELFFIDTDRSYTVSEANAPNVDLTRTIRNLPENALAGEVQGKLNQEFDLPHDDRFKLDQFVEVATTSAPAALTGSRNIYYKAPPFTTELSDYFVTDFDTGLPPFLGTGFINWIVLVPHDTEITSFQGIESLSATAVEINQDIRIDTAPEPAYDVYDVQLPATASPTNFFVPFGTVTTISEIDPTALVKIRADNVEAQFLQQILNRTSSNTGFSEGLQDFNQHITVAGVAGMTWQSAVNPSFTRATVNREYAAFWDEDRTQVANRTNYFDDLGNPVETVAPNALHYYTAAAADDGTQNANFTGKQSYVFGDDFQVQGAPLTANWRKMVWFEFNVPVMPPAGERIPLLRVGPSNLQRLLSITSNGLEARQGNRDGDPVNRTVHRFLPVVGQGGTVAHFSGDDTATIRFDVDTTLTFPITYTVQFRRIRNGAVDANASFNITVTDPNVTTSDVAITLFDNATPATDLVVNYQYDAMFSTIGGVIELEIDDQNNTTTQYDVDVFHAVTETFTSSTTVSWIAVSDFHGRNTVVAGETNSIGILFERTVPEDQSADPILSLKISYNGLEDNDFFTHLQTTYFDFDDLNFGDPNGEVAIANIQVYNLPDTTQPINFPRHSELHAMYLRRNEWLGLFRSTDFASRNYTIAGNAILTDTDDTTFDVIQRIKDLEAQHVHNTVFVSGSFITGAASVVLPVDYTTYDACTIVTRSTTPLQLEKNTIPVSELARIGSLEFQIGTNRNVTFTIGTRTLALVGGASEIHRVVLWNY